MRSVVVPWLDALNERRVCCTSGQLHAAPSKAVFQAVAVKRLSPTAKRTMAILSPVMFTRKQREQLRKDSIEVKKRKRDAGYIGCPYKMAAGQCAWKLDGKVAHVLYIA